MQTQNISYLPRLDHLRFYAAFLVFLFHFYLFASGLLMPGRPDNILIAIINEGYAGVSLFFVLSGFIFTLIGYGKEIRYKDFMINRFLRIFPLFLFMFFIAISVGRDQFNPADIFYGNADLFVQLANETGKLRVNVFEKLRGHKR